MANITTLPREQQKQRLALKKAFRPPFSLEHVRRNQGVFIGAADSLPLTSAPLDDAKSIDALVRSCRSSVEATANVCRAKALIEFRKNYLSTAYQAEFRSFPISIDTFVKIADPFLLVINDKAYVPASDLRKSGKLTKLGREFFFALKFHLILDSGNDDFAQASLILLDYWQEGSDSFGLTPHFFSGKPAYSFEELSNMIRFTYDLWNEVLDEEAEEARRREGASLMPLFAQA